MRVGSRPGRLVFGLHPTYDSTKTRPAISCGNGVTGLLFVLRNLYQLDSPTDPFLRRHLLALDPPSRHRGQSSAFPDVIDVRRTVIRLELVTLRIYRKN